jgi:DNA-binding MarR family transcriptional regulator
MTTTPTTARESELAGGPRHTRLSRPRERTARRAGGTRHGRAFFAVLATRRTCVERKARNPDIGVLAVRLLFTVQLELFDRLCKLGFDDVRPRHGAVLAYLDEAGVRPGELARQARRRKQTIGAILDDLERLGYISRRPDPQDRRAALIVPTHRGLAFMRTSDSIIGEIEARNAAQIGGAAYARLKRDLRSITSQEPEE